MKLHYTIPSGHLCKDCGKTIKANLANKKKHPVLRCYKCYRISIGKPPHHVPRQARIAAGLPVHNHQ